jgi:epidermal growth factor receptor substrate 15
VLRGLDRRPDRCAAVSAATDAKQQEKQYYDALWKRADTNNDGQLNGTEAVHFLRHSGLSVDQLEAVWNVIDVQKKGFWTQVEFYYGLRLIGLVQHGAQPSSALLRSTAVFPIPRFDSVAVAAPLGLGSVRNDQHTPPPPDAAHSLHRSSSAAEAEVLARSSSTGLTPAEARRASAPSSAVATAAATTTTAAAPAAAASSAAAPSPSLSARRATVGSATAFPAHVTRQQLQQYQQFFATLDVFRAGYLAGQQARDFLVKSNLPSHVLGRVWELADADHDGKLTFPEFVLAMHLVNAIIAGCTIPSPLPLSLHPSAIVAGATV